MKFFISPPNRPCRIRKWYQKPFATSFSITYHRHSMLDSIPAGSDREFWCKAWNVYGGYTKTAFSRNFDGVFVIGVDLGKVEKISSESVTINFVPIDVHVNLNRKVVSLPIKNGWKFLSSNHSEILATSPESGLLITDPGSNFFRDTVVFSHFFLLYRSFDRNLKVSHVALSS